MLIRVYESEYKVENDKDGKDFYKTLEKELKEISVERTTLINIIVDYLFKKESKSMTETVNYLKTQLGAE